MPDHSSGGTDRWLVSGSGSAALGWDVRVEHDTDVMEQL